MIEDFNGNTNEVALTSGDVLLYESSKCLHGRPANFSGSWYSSLFLHYAPVDWDPHRVHMDSHYRIPPDWNQKVWKDDALEELVLIETSMFEPECEHVWCGLKDSLKWNGPGEAVGKVLSAGNVTTELNLPGNIPKERDEL